MRSLDVAVDDRLGAVLDEVDELAEALHAVDHDADQRARARDLAAVATLRLDGSPIEDVPHEVPPPPDGTATGPARGSWLQVLRSGARGLEDVPDEVLLAIEHRGARAGLDADTLGARIGDGDPDALALLHATVTEGLLHPTVAGAPRRSDQAVHDASVGRVLFFPVDRDRVPARLDRLATWLAAAEAVHPVVRSGVLQHQVLDLPPYEAANGRLARIAARLVLATGGVDRHRIAQPEQVLLLDSIGYLDEVARSRRLGDPGAFVERWAEAVADGLLAAVRTPGSRWAPPTVPDETVDFLVDRGDTPFTIVDHRRAVGGDDAADDALWLARRAGLARRLLGTRGLRWVSTAG